MLDIFNSLNQNEKIGFGATQIFNGGKAYPHESHLRAPIWFAKSECLKLAKWEFNSDHDGEMKIGFQLAATGYIGIQVGNKIDLAYDSLEANHITQLIEKKFFKDKNLLNHFENNELNFFSKNLNNFNIKNEFIISPYNHIGKQNIFKDIEMFDNLIFLPTLEIAKKQLKLKEVVKNTFIIDNEQMD